MAAYESMVLLSLLFVKKYANQKADIFLQNGKEVSVLSEMYNFYNTISAFEHFVFLNDRGLINIVHMDHYTPLAVFMKDGYRLSSNPFVMKYIKSALQNITL